MSNKGMTLVELIAAMAIVSLLLAATLTVTTRSVRNRELFRRSETTDRLGRDLRHVLELDLDHCLSYREIEDGVELQGFLALNPATLQASHRPTVVRYRIEKPEDAQAGWLIREQVSAAQQSFCECVCPNVKTISLQAEGDEEDPDARNQKDWQALPGRYAVCLEFTETHTTPASLELEFRK